MQAEEKQMIIPATPRTYSQVFRTEDPDPWGPSLIALTEDELAARERADVCMHLCSYKKDLFKIKHFRYVT